MKKHFEEIQITRLTTAFWMCCIIFLRMLVIVLTKVLPLKPSDQLVGIAFKRIKQNLASDNFRKLIYFDQTRVVGMTVYLIHHHIEDIHHRQAFL